MKKELVWNVYKYNINQQQMETYNIFNHGGFYESLYKLKTKYLRGNNLQFNIFAEELRKELMYYFWSKCEYEILISAWCGSNKEEEIKVDIYAQVMNNWEAFKEYLFNNYKLIKKRKYQYGK